MYNSRFDRGERGRQERPRGRRNDDRSFGSERFQEKRRHPFVSDRWEDNEDSRERAPRRNSFDSEDRGERRFGERNDRRFDREDRRSSFNREDRGERRFGREDRRGSFNREDRGERRFDREDRRGSFNREDRGERRFDRDDRRGSFNREDRGERRFGRDDRRPSFDRDDRGRRGECRFGERSERRFGRDDRRPSFDRDDRGRRGESRFGERSDRRFGRDDRRSSFGRDHRDYRPRRQERGDQARHAENIQKKEDGYIRLNRYIANAGICSRREADTMIESGAIMVNGEVCTVLGTLVGPNDKVQFGGQTLSAEKKVYLVMNKPKGYITTSDDPQERKTVMDLVRDACRERIYPVGRLDRNTTGVLLFTNDGDMAKNLTHPSHGARKIYHVTLDRPLAKSDLSAISRGVDLEDGLTEVDEIAYVDEGDRKEIGIQLHSGKNRVVRRIFEHFGYEVAKLDRVLFAELTKKDLSRGQWRFLTEQEINFLKMNSGKKPVVRSAGKAAVFTAEQLEQAEVLAQAEEAPVKKRTSRKKAVEAEAEPEEAPVKKRTSRKKAVEAETEPEEAPVKKRTSRKKAVEAETEPEEAPVKKRTSRKKAVEAETEPEEAPVKKRTSRKKTEA